MSGGSLALRATFVVALSAIAAGCGRGTSSPALLPTASAATPATATEAAGLLPLPEPPGGARSRARVTTLANGAALVTGGIASRGPTAQVLYYSPLLGKFVELPPLRDPRYGHEATLLPGRDGALGTADDEVLVTGGYDGKRLLPTVELIQVDAVDPARSRVVALAPLPLGRSEHRAVLVSLGGGWSGDVGVLILGGFVPVPGGDPEVTSAALVYRIRRGEDGVVGTAVFFSQPRVARYEHAAVLLPGPDGVAGSDDDRVLVWGGIGYDPREEASAIGPLSSGEVYEPGLDRWSALRLEGDALELASTPRRSHRGARVGGSALLVGGTDGARERRGLRDALVVTLDPRDAGRARFARGATLSKARRDPEVVELEDGRILVAGGVDVATGQSRADAEVVSANGLTVEATLALGGGRVQHGLATLGARVLVFGGLSDPGVFAPPTAGVLLRTK